MKGIVGVKGVCRLSLVFLFLLLNYYILTLDVLYTQLGRKSQATVLPT
jgi:hypothetical protein